MPMSQENQIRPSEGLRHVKYEIRGRLARRAQELERQGYEIVPLNIGNPAAFGFRTPETMRLAMIENMPAAEGYCHQKGIFPAREAVVMQQQARGITGISAEEVFIGNGVSELIDLCLRALLNDGDEVLIPSPDYPLWSAAVMLNGGKAVYYPCRPENDFVPDPGRSPRWSRARRAPLSSSILTIRRARCIRARSAKPSRPSRRNTSWSCSATRSTTR
jgi:alanine-synthesizing transaminase